MAMVIYQRDALQQRRPGHLTPPTPGESEPPCHLASALLRLNTNGPRQPSNKCHRTMCTCEDANSGYLAGHVPPRGRGVRRVIWRTQASHPGEAALPARVVTKYLVADLALFDLADGLVQDGDPLIRLRLGHDQRRGDFHDVGVDAAVEHHEAELERAVHDFRHLAASRLLGSPVAHGL